MLVEGGAVSVVVVIPVGDEQVGVDHFVEECLDEILSGSKLQKGRGEPEIIRKLVK